MSKDDTIITEGAGEKATVNDRAEQIMAQIETTTSD